MWRGRANLVARAELGLVDLGIGRAARAAARAAAHVADAAALTATDVQ